MAGEFVGSLRAIGQGLGMGYGDEAEAWLRAKAGQGSYPENVKRIRDEYRQYSETNPFTANLVELTSGVAPGVVAMMFPGGQPAGAAITARAATGPLTKLMQSQATKNIALGATTGAAAAQGKAEQPGLSPDAFSGALVGGVLGGVIPPALSAIGTGYRWLQNFHPTEALTARRAAANINSALQDAKLSPAALGTTFQVNQALGVPSIVANLDPRLARQATQALRHSDSRVGVGIEDILQKQQAGTRDRVMNQVNKGLKSGKYYDDLTQLEQDMKDRAGPLYDDAYAHGEVTDPKVLSFLERDVFKKGMAEANESLNTRGIKADLNVPTVENLDHVKRGLDSLIEKETDPITGKMTSKGRDLVGAKTEFLGALDTAVPSYGLARGVFAGGAELRDAMRTGLHDWSRMPSEKVATLVAKMNDGEKAALRTGVARHLYDRIAGPSTSGNSAQKIIGSPDTQSKLRPLFDSDGEFNLFKAALEREAQLYQQSRSILSRGMNPNASELVEGKAIPTAIHRGMLWGWGNGLASLASSAINRGAYNNEVAGKMATMLSAGTPTEVAAVVKQLEEHAAQAAATAAKHQRGTYGAIAGTTNFMTLPDVGPLTQEANPQTLEEKVKAQEAMPQTLEERWQGARSK
jgi:hypothetical protein